MLLACHLVPSMPSLTASLVTIGLHIQHSSLAGKYTHPHAMTPPLPTTASTLQFQVACFTQCYCYHPLPGVWTSCALPTGTQVYTGLFPPGSSLLGFTFQESGPNNTQPFCPLTLCTFQLPVLVLYGNGFVSHWLLPAGRLSQAELCPPDIYVLKLDLNVTVSSPLSTRADVDSIFMDSPPRDWKYWKKDWFLFPHVIKLAMAMPVLDMARFVVCFEMRCCHIALTGWNSLRREGMPWTPSEPPASAFWALGYLKHATICSALDSFGVIVL